MTEDCYAHIVGQFIHTTVEPLFYAYDKGWTHAQELTPEDWILTDIGQLETCGHTIPCWMDSLAMLLTHEVIAVTPAVCLTQIPSADGRDEVLLEGLDEAVAVGVAPVGAGGGVVDFGWPTVHNRLTFSIYLRADLGIWKSL